MKRTITLITLLLTIAGYTRAQVAVNSDSYKTAIGLRAGGTSGLTVKHFFSANKAGDFIIGFWDHGFSLTGLYEIHADAGAPGLRWYYGVGAHIAAASDPSGRYYDNRWYYYRHDGFGIGIDGIVGIEYKIHPIPFAISLDLKPMLEVTNNGNAYVAVDPGLGLKFTF